MTPTATETQFLIVGAWGQLLVALVLAAVLAWQHRLHARATVLMWSLSFLAMAVYVLGAASSFALAQRGAPVDDGWRLAAMLLSLSAAHAQIAWLVLGTLWIGRSGAVPRRVQAITVGGAAALGALLALSYAGDPAGGETAMRGRLGLLYLLVALAYLLCGIRILLRQRGSGGRSRRALGSGFAIYGAMKLILVAQILWGAPGTGEAPATGIVVLVELLGLSTVGIGIAVWLLADERRRAVAAQAHVTSLLRFDPVTGLHNRAGLAERWPELRDEQSVVIVLAIEGFERAAPRLAAHADRLLQGVAQRLQDAHGPERVAQLERARFAVLAGDGVDAARAQVAALLQLVEGLLDNEAPAEELLPVAGLAAARAGESAADPLARASAACDEARRLGGSRWIDAEAALPGASDPLVRLRALRDAFDRGEFEMHFQPQQDIEHGRLYGFEALVRWRHPQAGLLLPGRFTGAIERTGLSRRLDATVVELACAQLRAWIDAGLGAPRIAINLGAESIADQDLPEMLGDALARHRLSAHHFAIELTETAALQDVTRCARVVGRLRAFGFGVALDDFGTGFSSLAHLRDLPVDTIKIDQRFIRGAIVEARDAALVRGLAGLCASLGLRVVAEGVETAEQAAFARSCGIGVQQGWLYAPALSATEAADWIARAALQPAA